MVLSPSIIIVSVKEVLWKEGRSEGGRGGREGGCALYYNYYRAWMYKIILITVSRWPSHLSFLS